MRAVVPLRRHGQIGGSGGRSIRHSSGVGVGSGIGGGVGGGVGACVGAAVGAAVGRGVGAGVGRGVGAAVGRAVGALVGALVGGGASVGPDRSVGVVGSVTPGAPPGEPGVVGNVGEAGPWPGGLPGDPLANGLAPTAGLGARDACPTTIVPGDDSTGTATTCWTPGPDGAGTMLENALARTIAMSRPKPIPMAVWR